MITRNPIRKPGIFVKDIGREILLSSAQGDAVHALNPTAKIVWELCDGEHSVDDIARAIRARFAVSEHTDVAGDVLKTIQVLTDKGLLTRGDI